METEWICAAVETWGGCSGSVALPSQCASGAVELLDSTLVRPSGECSRCRHAVSTLLTLLTAHEPVTRHAAPLISQLSILAAMFGRAARSIGPRARRHRLAAAVTSATAIVAAYSLHNSDSERYTLHASSSSAATVTAARTIAASTSAQQQQPSLVFPPSRSDSLAALKRPDVVYDLLIIGGGATGAGIALDATLRGLSTALVEASDFSSGASSRSTKLIHGGIRYLQKAFTQLDVAQYNLVVEALSERRHLLAIAPHLAHSFPIIVPVYASGLSGLFWVPYYWAGCKAYDVVAGKAAVLERSYFLSAKRAIEKFPMLKSDGLWGGVVYYDGQHNDTRMNVAIVLTAAQQGAQVANHCRVTSLLTEEARTGEKGTGRVVGARVRDELTGDEWNIRAREVINATGPLTDSVRHMADPSSPSCITPSAGIHIVLPASYSPPDMGLIVPKTSDGRVLFLLPWEGSTLVGTTDYLSPVTALPSPHESDIEFLLREISAMLKVDVKRDDVRSVWSGIRPLAKDVKATSTQAVNRDHLIERTWEGLTTISGGKWTTYRKMAEDVLDTVLKRQGELRERWERESGSGGSASADWLIDTSQLEKCSSWCYPLLGTRNFTPQLADEMLAQYGSQLSAVTTPSSPTPISASSASTGATPPSASLTTSPSHTTTSPTPSSIIHHLAHNYGDRAPLVLSLAASRSDFSLLSPRFPFLTAELLYAVRHEYAMRAVDVLAHRTRLCFLDTAEAEKAVGRVVEVMGEECGWDEKRRREEVRHAKRFLETMKCSVTNEAKADAAAAHEAAVDELEGAAAA